MRRDVVLDGLLRELPISEQIKIYINLRNSLDELRQEIIAIIRARPPAPHMNRRQWWRLEPILTHITNMGTWPNSSHV